MNYRVTHPALHRLLWQRAVAKMIGIRSRLFAPKRWFVTLIAFGLACAWLSQVLAAVFLRQPADPYLLAERIAVSYTHLTLPTIYSV